MKGANFEIINKAAGQKGLIILTGLISSEKNAANSIRAAIEAYNADNRYSSILIEIVNCYGGSVYEGLGILHYMRASKKPIHTKVVGIAASMAFPIFLGGAEREMVQGSRIMCHEVKGGIQGSADQVESYSKELKQANKDLLLEITSMTEMDESHVVANLMRPGVDTYLTADECYKNGLATAAPTAGKIKKDIPQNVLESTEPQAVVNYYVKQIKNSIKTDTKMEKLPLMAAALGLDADATESQVLTAVQKIVNAHSTLEGDHTKLKVEHGTIEASLKTLKEAEDARQETAVETLVAQAITDGKVKAEQKESLVAWAKTDFVGASGFIQGLDKPHVPITAHLNKGTGADAAADPMASMSYKELVQTTEGSSYLQALMASDPVAFKELKAASYPAAS